MSLKKSFNFLDIVAYSQPNVLNIDIARTALCLQSAQKPRFFAYSSVVSRIGRIIKSGMSHEEISGTFNFYKDAWKNNELQQVAHLLNNHIGAKGKWFKERRYQNSLFGVSFWPAQHGVWYHDRRPYNVLLNPRKYLHLSAQDARFIGRAIYELHGIDDPNNPDQIILDVSSPKKGQARTMTIHNMTEAAAVSLPEFENVLMRFFESLAAAGMADRPKSGKDISEILRRRPSR